MTQVYQNRFTFEVYNFQAKKLKLRQKNVDVILMGLTQLLSPGHNHRNDRNDRNDQIIKNDTFIQP